MPKSRSALSSSNNSRSLFLSLSKFAETVGSGKVGFMMIVFDSSQFRRETNGQQTEYPAILSVPISIAQHLPSPGVHSLCGPRHQRFLVEACVADVPNRPSPPGGEVSQRDL